MFLTSYCLLQRSEVNFCFVIPALCACVTFTISGFQDVLKFFVNNTLANIKCHSGVFSNDFLFAFSSQPIAISMRDLAAQSGLSHLN